MAALRSHGSVLAREALQSMSRYEPSAPDACFADTEVVAHGLEIMLA